MEAQDAGVAPVTTNAEYEAALRKSYPDIPWRKPILVTVPSVGSALGCRLCIARFGLKGSEVGGLFKTELEFKQHLTEDHPDLTLKPDA